MTMQSKICTMDANSWDQIINGFQDASIYQTRSYGIFRWGKENLSYFVFEEDGEVAGACQIATIVAPVFGTKVAYVPWGPLWKRKGHPADPALFSRLIKALKLALLRQGWDFIRIAPRVYKREIAASVYQVLKNEYSLNKKRGTYRTLTLDLRPDLEELRKNLRQKWRNQLNKAEKNDLEITIGTDLSAFDEHIALQEEMEIRKNFRAGVDYKGFRTVQNELSEHHKMRVLRCMKAGVLVASMVFTAIGNEGIYLFGATGDAGLTLKGSYLLQWEGIRWMKDFGCTSYDLGGIDPETNSGVHHFKSGISSNDVLMIGQYEIARNTGARLFIKTGEHLKTWLGRMQ